VQTELMKALGDGTRLAIFERLCQREFTVNDLKAQFAVSQPAVSQHLGVLKRCGLVRERRAGRFAHYRAKPEGLRPMVQWLAHYQKFWPERLNALGAVLNEMSPKEAPDDHGN
jgi:DNA-binding transcriptional ArsR family regulator